MNDQNKRSKLILPYHSKFPVKLTKNVFNSTRKKETNLSGVCYTSESQQAD